MKTDITNDTRNAVIIVMTDENNGNDIYNRIVGIPKNKSYSNAIEHIKIGTRIYIYYKGIGISKIVEAVSTPYVDYTVIPEWDCGQPEKYALRVNTKVIWDSVIPLKSSDVVNLGILHVNTGKPLVVLFPQHSLTPISAHDSDLIFNVLIPKSLSSWVIGGNECQRVD